MNMKPCSLRGVDTPVMCVISHSHYVVNSESICSYILASVRILAKYVKSLSVIRVIWRGINAYIVESVHILVMCVKSHSVIEVIWRDMNAYIVESVHTLAMYVVHHLKERVIWRDIKAYILESVRIPVMCVISLSGNRVIWRNINRCIMDSSYTVFTRLQDDFKTTHPEKTCPPRKCIYPNLRQHPRNKTSAKKKTLYN